MHGSIWLENPIISLTLLAIAFYLLYRALITEKHHREPQHSNSSYSLEKKFFGHKIIDTSKGWVFFTSFLVLTALGTHCNCSKSLLDKKQKILLYRQHSCLLGSICSLGGVRMDLCNL